MFMGPGDMLRARKEALERWVVRRQKQMSSRRSKRGIS